MSRPRVLADNDLNDAIVVGLLRHEPAEARSYPVDPSVDHPEARGVAGWTPKTRATNALVRRFSASELHLYLSVPPAL
jgi:hypothetical protein